MISLNRLDGEKANLNQHTVTVLEVIVPNWYTTTPYIKGIQPYVHFPGSSSKRNTGKCSKQHEADTGKKKLDRQVIL